MPSLVIYSAHGSKVSNLTGSTLDEAESISANINMSISNSAKSGSICDSVSASNESISEVILGSVTKQLDHVSVGDLRVPLFRLQMTLKKRIELATHDAVVSLSEAMSNKKKGKRLKKGTLTSIINAAKHKHNVVSDVTILESTVPQRLKHNSNNGKSGLSSPIESIKPYIVSIIIQLANMRAPISSSQGLALCNSIIEGTKFQEDVVAYKKSYCQSVNQKLGLSYWKGFFEKKQAIDQSKKGLKVRDKMI